MSKHYWLLLMLVILPLGAVWAQTSGTIAYGDEVTDTISDEDPVHHWTFEGSAGDTITIVMEASDLAEGGLDSYLQLLDPAGEIIAENDDASNATVNAKIEAFSLPTDGSYTIIASRFGLESGLAVGDYRLTLTLEGSGEATPESPTTAADVRPILFDTPVAGTLNRQNYEDMWSFDGQQGDSISISMRKTSEGSDLDTFLRLLDAESRELGRNDDGATGIGTSEILNFELPYTGSYTIVATRYGFESGTSSGDYVLEVTAGESTSSPTVTPTAEPNFEEAVPVTYGESVAGSLTANATAVYSFEGSTGDPVTISVKRTSGELDPAVSLLDAENNVQAENDQFNGAADARIVAYPLPADGTYYIQVSSENGSSGDYILYLFADPTIPSTSSSSATDEPPVVEAPPLDLSNATLVISVSWEGAADFDLGVTEPDGTLINYSTTESASGGKFGGDANGGCAAVSAAPSETVYWETTAPKGDYQIEVAHVFPCEEASPVSFTVTVSLDGEVVETIDGELNEGEAITYDRTLE